jgi:hypothetical protein
LASIAIVSDLFYEFPARPIDPTVPASRHQNTVIMRALGRASQTFAEGGYDVALDGVFGPWFLPVLLPELAGAWPISLGSHRNRCSSRFEPDSARTSSCFRASMTPWFSKSPS